MDFSNSDSSSSMSYCDLNTKFNDRCYMDWSKTNLISVVTLEGIYILEPHLERPHGPFKIELIRNPINKFKHKTNSDSNGFQQFDELLPALNNRQYIEIFLDSALSTNVADLPSATVQQARRFRLAKWSPVIEKYPKECLLAAITIDYQLLIYGRKNTVWVEIADLSQEYDKVWKNLNSKTNSGDFLSNDFESIRSNLHALSFCDICWDTRERSSGNLNKTSLNLLATTMHGDIVVWRLSYSRQIIDQTRRAFDQIRAEVKLILRTRQNYISCMNLHQGLLVASSRNGQVALYDLNINLEKIDAGVTQTTTNNLPNQIGRRNAAAKQSKQSATIGQFDNQIEIDLPPTAVLWHQDNIEVMDFYLQSIDREKSRMVLTKSTNICWCMIQYIKRTETNSATLIVEDSFSAIDGLTPEVSLHQTPATWLRPANNKRAVLIAEDGSFFLLNFLEDNQDVSPSFSSIMTGKIDLTDMIPRGVCVSPNGHLISMISSVTYMYDPAKLPAPSRLITLPTQNDKDFLTTCVQNLLDETWLEAKGIKSPMDVCDLIDYLRSLFPTWTLKQCDKLPNLLKKSLNELGEPRTEAQFLKIKIIGFVLLKLISYHSNIGTKIYENNVNEYYPELDLSIYPIILYHEIEEVLAFIREGSKTDYSIDQMNSLQNYLSWMELDCSNHNAGLFCQTRFAIRDQFRTALSAIKSKQAQIVQELCSICKSEIPLESAYYSQCKNEHRFVRCSRSLLTIDLRKDDEIECQHCRRHFVIDNLWPTSNLWTCLYCQ